MKTLKTILATVAAAISMQAMAQNSISGIILNANSQPLASATAVLLHGEDSTIAHIVRTSRNGSYHFNDVKDASYFVVAEQNGMKIALSKTFSVTDGAHKEVADLQISGAKTEASPLLTDMDGKLIVDVHNSVFPVGGTAWDMLLASPGVAFNGSQVLLNDHRVTLSLDGKNTDLSVEGMKNMLRGVKATELSGLELISVPMGHQEGKGPSINVITLKGEKEGVYGEVITSAGYGKTLKTDNVVNLNLVKGGFIFTGGYEFSNNRSISKDVIGQDFTYEGMPVMFSQQSTTISDPTEHSGSFAMQFKGQKGFKFTASITGTNSTSNGTSDYTTTLNFPILDTSLVSTSNYIDHTSDASHVADFTIGQTIAATHSNLTYEFKTGREFIAANEQFAMESESGTHGGSHMDLYRLNMTNDLLFHVHELTFTQAIGQHLITVAGVKQVAMSNGSTRSIDQMMNNSWEDAGYTHRFFNYNRDIRSAYVINYITLGKTEIAASLEAQQVASNGSSQSEMIDRNKSGISFFPALSVEQKINANNSVKLSFEQSIKRPSFSDLNPSGHYSNQYTYVVGNPLLKPELTNTVDLEYTLFSLVELTGGLDVTSNGIETVSRQDDVTGMIIQSKMNISKSRDISAGISCPLPIGKHLIISNDLEWTWSNYQTEYNGATLVTNNRSFTEQGAVLVKLAGDFNIGFSGYYISPTNNGIVSTESMKMMNAEISKGMFNNRLTLTLSATDLFNTGGTKATILTPEGNITYSSKGETQSFNLKASFNFGNPKADQSKD